ncbi:MAG: acyl-CoA dehydratase activase [Synergistaceae bacterium]|jgi:predicted CoA-substrate-specific enzyme activase|nr:acyl-CoA dehydratase activase [Synergistaceae bacterium]
MEQVTVGIDIGSASVKAVLFDGVQVLAHRVTPAGWNPGEVGAATLDELLFGFGMAPGDLAGLVTTGYGRNCLEFGEPVTEITCHAVGASILYPSARTVLDIGGQDSKAISVGSGGVVLDFLMNDKCAAGTGRFLQNMAVLLGYKMKDFSGISDVEPCPISSMCAVFAESEVIGLLARGVNKSALAQGLIDSIASRAESMLRKLGGFGPIAFTGGLSQSTTLTSFLERKMSREVFTSDMGQLAGALGAAAIAMRRIHG